ncbi:carbohydrate ABC transporter permease [Paenibacillus silvisoli]|uniref:carbohydrate ABC transporter permease n=1 Tax=Paenibacillus silvisoli TaxID=3110539 RepID=UPI002805FADD|nr:carbohydrate ABC transporter permease [Paenibacillus silvisoli]
MVGKSSISRKLFVGCNTAFLLLFCAFCILPFVHLLALSLSSKSAASVGLVFLWPVEFTMKSYQFVLQKPEFLKSLGITVERVALGTFVNMALTILAAYPLAKEKKHFRFRTVYVWFFVFTLLFSGGLIPTYMVVSSLELKNTIWALIIPGALPIFNLVLLLNFFRGLPKEIEESAFMDGAGHYTILWKMYVPLSAPALATIGLFAVVGHWNSWFDGLIYMSSPTKYPLQTYLQSLVIETNSKILTKATAELLRHISDRTVRAAQIFIGALPVLMIYPFLQKYFMSGIVLGSVKE